MNKVQLVQVCNYLSEFHFYWQFFSIAYFLFITVGNSGEGGQKGKQGDQGQKGFKGNKGPIVRKRGSELLSLIR